MISMRPFVIKHSSRDVLRASLARRIARITVRMCMWERPRGHLQAGGQPAHTGAIAVAVGVREHHHLKTRTVLSLSDLNRTRLDLLPLIACARFRWQGSGTDMCDGREQRLALWPRPMRHCDS